mgnify:CR=1 FL=1
MTLDEKVEAARAVLKALEEGRITAKAQVKPQDVFAGDVVYDLSNGWKMTVFNDCGDWDYVDSFELPNGEHLTYEEMTTCDESDEDKGPLYPDLVRHTPTEEVQKRVYGWHCSYLDSTSP